VNTRDFIVFSLSLALLVGTIGAMLGYSALQKARPDQIRIVMRSPERGGFDPLDIYVTLGEPAKLYVKNEALETHGFAVPELGIGSIEVKPGRHTTLEFTPEKEGTFAARCSVYCSDFHPLMQMRVHVLPRGEASAGAARASTATDLLREFPADIVRDPEDLPPPLRRNTSEVVEVHLDAVEVVDELSGEPYAYWTFNGKVPGPFLRVREGDTVELTLSNGISSKYDHSIDLHAVTGQGGGAAFMQVAPGESKKIRFNATNAGIFVYHCATSDIPTHMTHGMYGLILVEPKEGLPEVDREYYFMQGELYAKDAPSAAGFREFSFEKMLDEDADYVVWNGKPAAITGTRSPVFRAGEALRLFVGNGGVSYLSSFHVIGEIFDRVFPEGALGHPHGDVQTTTIPAGGATIAEFHTEMPAKYILVDHALSRLNRGAVAVIVAEGEPPNGSTLEAVPLAEAPERPPASASSGGGLH